MTTKTYTTTVWNYDLNKGVWTLVDTATRNQRVLAEVRHDGSWQTYDMDGAGGESSQEYHLEDAKKEAEASLREQGYL